MSAPRNVVISAAGIGSRLGLNRPKALVEIAGRSLLDYHLERLREVENVWLVVGFQEQEVMAHARALRPDILFVRNPDYMRTNTLQSIYLAARLLREPFLIVDADTVVEPQSFARFMRAASQARNLVGVSRITTSEGVRVLLDDQGQVTRFTRDPSFDVEWAGIAMLDPSVVSDTPIFVYEALEPHLPLASCELDAFDIDTIADLDMARDILASEWQRPFPQERGV